MTMSAHPALVLNADFRPMSYFPLSLLCWEDAVQAVFSERVAVVAEYDTWAHSPSTKIRLPSVVALRKYQRSARRVAFTRFNVFLRDRFTCQYCGVALRLQLTFGLTRGRVVARRPGHRLGLRACNRAKGSSTRMKPRVHHASRQRRSCWPPSAHSRPTIPIRVGWIISTGMWSWKRNRLVAQRMRAPPSEGGGRAFKSRRDDQQPVRVLSA